MFVCGGGSEALVFPDAGEGHCCYGTIMNGPQGCTCWEPIYDLEQQEPRLGKPRTRRRRCPDCAYHDGSPERQNTTGYAGDAETLDEIVYSGERFICHQGMRKPSRWIHVPTGTIIEGHPAGYEPPFLNGLPYKADGTPGDICAGWSRARRRYLADVEQAVGVAE